MRRKKNMNFGCSKIRFISQSAVLWCMTVSRLLNLPESQTSYPKTGDNLISQGICANMKIPHEKPNGMQCTEMFKKINKIKRHLFISPFPKRYRARLTHYARSACLLNKQMSVFQISP
jgi:hypothetical protein